MEDQTDDMTSAETQSDGEVFVSDYLLYLLAAASHAASAQFHSHVRDNGLRIAEWRVLACLAERDGQMITRLAQFALYEQSRLTRIIEKMEEKGLVSRRADARDGRRVRVYLTDEGRAVTNRLVATARTHEAQLLSAGADAGSGQDLKAALKALIAHLGANVSEPE